MPVKAKVVFAYQSEQADELSLSLGDVISKVDMQEGGWWEGEVKGKRGLFPENFVEVINEEVPAVIKPSPFPKATAVFDYEASEADELNLFTGDVIEVINQDEEGWWEGKFNGNVGMFPSNFVELIKSDNAATDPTSKPTPAVPMDLQNEVPASDMLIDFKEQPCHAPDRAPAPLPVQEEDPDAGKPKQPMGFGFQLSNADLMKVSLRPVSTIEEPKKPVAKENDKPMQRVPPLGKAEDVAPILKKTEPAVNAANPKRNAPAPPVEPGSTENPPSITGEKYIVKFPYEPENDDEIGLELGQTVYVLNKDVCEGWWEGRKDGKTGVFPNNFVEPAPEPAAVEVAPKEKVKKLPLVPNSGKVPVLPVRKGKEEPKEALSTDPKPTLTKTPLMPEVKKPPPPEVIKPLAPVGPARPVPKKPEEKKLPPPLLKKPVHPKPNLADKQLDHDVKAKNAFNAVRLDRNRLASFGRKPPVRPSHEPVLLDSKEPALPVSKEPAVPLAKEPVLPLAKEPVLPLAKEPVLPLAKEPVLPLAKGPVLEVAKEPASEFAKQRLPLRPDRPKHDEPSGDKVEERDLDLDSLSTEVLSNVNKTRVKGPGKTLPGKYIQKKDDKLEEVNVPPWKKEVTQKLTRRLSASKSDSMGTKPDREPSKPTLPEPSKPTLPESSEKLQIGKEVVEDFRKELSAMRDKMAEMEKRLVRHISVLTEDLDSERKDRASLQIEVDRLKKKVSVLEGL